MTNGFKGSIQVMKSITVEDVVPFHQKIIRGTGGIDGIRDRGAITLGKVRESHAVLWRRSETA